MSRYFRDQLPSGASKFERLFALAFDTNDHERALFMVKDKDFWKVTETRGEINSQYIAAAKARGWTDVLEAYRAQLEEYGKLSEDSIAYYGYTKENLDKWF